MLIKDGTDSAMASHSRLNGLFQCGHSELHTRHKVRKIALGTWDTHRAQALMYLL